MLLILGEVGGRGSTWTSQIKVEEKRKIEAASETNFLKGQKGNLCVSKCTGVLFLPWLEKGRRSFHVWWSHQYALSFSWAEKKPLMKISLCVPQEKVRSICRADMNRESICLIWLDSLPSPEQLNMVVMMILLWHYGRWPVISPGSLLGQPFNTRLRCRPTCPTVTSGVEFPCRLRTSTNILQEENEICAKKFQMGSFLSFIRGTKALVSVLRRTEGHQQICNGSADSPDRQACFVWQVRWHCGIFRFGGYHSFTCFQQNETLTYLLTRGQLCVRLLL